VAKDLLSTLPAPAAKERREMKLIAVEEHFLTHEVRLAWADPASATDPAAAFDGGEIGRRLEDLG
jgi:uncharacterized protein